MMTLSEAVDGSPRPKRTRGPGKHRFAMVLIVVNPAVMKAARIALRTGERIVVISESEVLLTHRGVRA